MKFWYGAEKFLIWSNLMDLKKEFQMENPKGEIKEFDFEEISANEVEEKNFQQNDLFATEKLLIFRNVLTLPTGEQKKIKEFLQKERLCRREDLTVVFVELSEKKKSALSGILARYLKQQGEFKEFKKLTEEQLRQWINAEFLKRSEKKVTVEIIAINELIKITQANLWQISQEIDKLIAFLEKGQVDLDLVQNLCSGKLEAKIFDLVNAIGEKNKQKALLLKERLLEQGENEFYIFTMIVFQLRNFLKVAECLRKGYKEPRVIKEKTGLHPFVLQKTLRNMGGFPLRRIKAIYQLVANLDKKSKQGKLKMEEALDNLILRI